VKRGSSLRASARGRCPTRHQAWSASSACPLTAALCLIRMAFSQVGLAAREEAGDPRLEDLGRGQPLDVDEDFPDPEEPHGDQHELESLAELPDAVREAGAPHDRVETDHAEEQAEKSHDEALGHRRAREVADHHEAEGQEGEVLGGAEPESEARERGRQEHQAECDHVLVVTVDRGRGNECEQKDPHLQSRKRLAGDGALRLGIEMAQELVRAVRARYAGAYLMPSFGRFEVVAEVLDALH